MFDERHAESEISTNSMPMELVVVCWASDDASDADGDLVEST